MNAEDRISLILMIANRSHTSTSTSHFESLKSPVSAPIHRRIATQKKIPHVRPLKSPQREGKKYPVRQLIYLGWCSCTCCRCAFCRRTWEAMRPGRREGQKGLSGAAHVRLHIPAAAATTSPTRPLLKLPRPHTTPFCCFCFCCSCGDFWSTSYSEGELRKVLVN